MIRMPAARAAPTARTTFGEFPLVLMAISTSPGSPQRLDLPLEHPVEPAVVG